MKTIEKEFVNQLKELLNERIYSEQNNYYINKLIEIFNNENMESINLINFNDLSSLLDYFNYEGYNRGLLIIKVLLNNFKIIDSKPYSKINLMKYRNIYESRNISLEQFILDIRNLINGEDVELNEYRYEIFKMLQNEEKNRLINVRQAKKLKNAYECLNVEEIVNYFKLLNLSEKDIDGVKVYVSSLKSKKVVNNNSLSMDLKVIPTKLGYTNKEIKKMDDELNAILKEINENNYKLDYDDYLKFVRYVLVLEQNNKACDADIDRLYDALNINKKLYPFLISKAKFLLKTNKAIDIQNILQDINDIENILISCDEKDKNDFQNLLNNMYENLYHLDAYNHVYERSLYTKNSI